MKKSWKFTRNYYFLLYYFYVWLNHSVCLYFKIYMYIFIQVLYVLPKAMFCRFVNKIWTLNFCFYFSYIQYMWGFWPWLSGHVLLCWFMEYLLSFLVLSIWSQWCYEMVNKVIHYWYTVNHYIFPWCLFRENLLTDVQAGLALYWIAKVNHFWFLQDKG